MVRVGVAVCVALIVALLQACATEPGRAIQALFAPSKGQAALKTGLRQYEDGDYVDSMKSLHSALDQGLAEGERIDAHKHLAFIHCASSRERQCRDEFRKALAIDPSMELSAAESGHPVWGPIFRSLKR
ncbi:MAG TPA: TssQ family T6SS-associated lipoprotein [Burkholderiales bacterium]|nr:TssQ family T6SS-associated lipoprotein [Burkholderiales bacterium]